MPHRKVALLKGYKSFREGNYTQQKDLYETLGREGQKPKIMLIACADSRVDPTDIFDAYPGEMFVARNVANVVPPANALGSYHCTPAAIEYAVKEIGVESIVVLGHESCGGIKGCLAGLGDTRHSSYVGEWVSLMNNVRDKVLAENTDPESLQYEMEIENVRQSLNNLMTYDFVKEAVEADELKLQGAYFSIIKAQLLLSDDNGEFYEV